MDKSLKVAFCNRPHWNVPLGGDGIQMLRTKEELEKSYNIEISICTEPEQLSDDFDLVHIFNFLTINVTKSFFEKATDLGLPIVSSPIYWDYSYTNAEIAKFLFKSKFTRSTAMLLKYISKILCVLTGHPKLYSKVFRNNYNYFINASALIFPNSKEEASLLESFTGNIYCKEKTRVVVNGCDIKPTRILDNDEFKHKYQLPDDYVLQVGRIETIKNQINVVSALFNNPEIPIVFVGKQTEVHYLKKIKRLSRKRGNVFFIENVPHDEINSFYKYAALHILPSLRESPGLVSLEALANDCPIIICNEGFTPVGTYFKQQPYIINPFDLKQIKKTILKAYRERKLHKEDLYNFTWENAARQTWDAYCEILASQKAND